MKTIKADIQNKFFACNLDALRSNSTQLADLFSSHLNSSDLSISLEDRATQIAAQIQQNSAVSGGYCTLGIASLQNNKSLDHVLEYFRNDECLGNMNAGWQYIYSILLRANGETELAETQMKDAVTKIQLSQNIANFLLKRYGTSITNLLSGAE